MSTWKLSTELEPNYNGGLMRSKWLIGGIRTVTTKTQRNAIPYLFRYLSAEESTIVFVESENQLYKLINNPSTSTTDGDWELITLGNISSGLNPIGTWNINNTSPTLSDVGAAGNNGDFYFVDGAPTPQNVTIPGLFEGETTSVVDGNMIVSVGTRWVVVANSTAWDSINKPQSIIDYVNGTVIAHDHTTSEISDLATYLQDYLTRNDTADHTIDFNSVPDTGIIELEFLKTHYYTKQDVNDIINDLNGGGGGANEFLDLLDAPSAYTGAAGQFVRVNALEDTLEFSDAWAAVGDTTITTPNIIGNPTFQGQVTVNSLTNELAATIGNDQTMKVIIGVGRGATTSANFPFIRFDTALAGTSPGISYNNNALYLNNINLLHLQGVTGGNSELRGSRNNTAGVNLGIGNPRNSSGGGTSITSGTYTWFQVPYHVGVNSDWNPSSGTADFVAVSIPTRINTTGTYTGTVYGIDYSPTLTSTVGLTHIAARFTSGQVVINDSAPSASTTLTVKGMSGGNVYQLIGSATTLTAQYDGKLVFGNTTVGVSIYPTTNGNAVDLNGRGIGINSSNYTTALYMLNVAATTHQHSATTGNAGILKLGSRFISSSGDATFSAIKIAPEYGTSGSYIGTAYGIDYNPTLTTTTGLTHIAIRTTSGQVLFADSSSDVISSNTRLDVRGISAGNIIRLADSLNTSRWLLTDKGLLTHESEDTATSIVIKVENTLAGDSRRLFSLFNWDPSGKLTGHGGVISPSTSAVGMTLSSGGVLSDNSGGLTFVNANQPGSEGQFIFNPVNTTTGGYIFEIKGGVTGNSVGSGVAIGVNLNPELNYTAGTHTFRGIYYNPTLTSTTGLTHVAIQTTSGNIIFAGGSSVSMSSVNGASITSTTSSTTLTLNASGSNTGTIDFSSSSIQRNRLFWTNVGTYFTSSPFGIGKVAIADHNLSIAHTFAPTSGTGTSMSFYMTPTWNTTGTYVGTVRGIYYDPINTSLTGATHVAFESTSGNVIFGGGGSLTVTGGTVSEGTLTVGAVDSTGTINLRRAADGGVVGRITQQVDVTRIDNIQGSGLMLATAGNDRLTMTASVIRLLVPTLRTNNGSHTITANTSLDVRGTGTGTESIIRLADSNNIERVKVACNGDVYVGGGNNSIRFSSGQFIGSNSGIFNFRANGLSFQSAFNFTIHENQTQTTGTQELVTIGSPSLGFTVSSGTASYTTLLLSSLYNTTGTYTGTVRGIYYNPTVTSLTGATHIAFENTSGQLRFGGVTQDDTKTRILAIDDTTGQVFWRASSSLGGGGGWATTTATTTLTGDPTIDGLTGSRTLIIKSGTFRLLSDNLQMMDTTESYGFTVDTTSAGISGVAIAATSGTGGFVFNGTYTAGAHAVTFDHTVTGSASVSTSHATLNYANSFTYNANTQDYYAMYINPTLTAGAFTGTKTYGIYYFPSGTPASTHYGLVIASGLTGLGIAQPTSMLHIHQSALPSSPIDVTGGLTDSVLRYTTAATNNDPTVSIYQGRLATTTATVTTLTSVAIPGNNAVLVTGYVVARRTGGVAGTAQDCAAYRFEGLYKNSSGTATAVGTPVITVIGESQAGWDVVLTPSSGNVDIQVQGATDNDVTWHLSELKLMHVNS